MDNETPKQYYVPLPENTAWFSFVFIKFGKHGKEHKINFFTDIKLNNSLKGRILGFGLIF